jgi:phosphopantothenate synthetase
MKKQILSEEFQRMQKLADISLVENIIQEEEDLLEKYKEKIDQLRSEFIADLKSNLKGVKKLSKEDREKLSKIVRNLTFTVDDIF